MQDTTPSPIGRCALAECRPDGAVRNLQRSTRAFKYSIYYCSVASSKDKTAGSIGPSDRSAE